MGYRENKERAITVNNDPTETDQSQGHETDINVIVGRYGVGGVVPGRGQVGTGADTTALPDNLRDMIEMGRQARELKRRLPKELQDRSIEDILNLSNDDLKRILTPPAPTPEERPNPAGGNK